MSGSRTAASGGGLPLSKEEQEPGWDGHGCNPPGDTGEQRTAPKELKILLLSATKSFVKLSGLNLTDKLL